MQDFLLQYDKPEISKATLIFAFAGWADAAESATHALQYLVQELGAVKFAEIDPEEFYNFARVRPHTVFNDEGERMIVWPKNEFFYAKGIGGSEDIVLFSGIEPNLKWRTFAHSIVEMGRDLGVQRVVHMGALLDAVPHTRETRVTGSATSTTAQAMLEGIEARRSRYTGPTGITGVIVDAFKQQDIPCVSVWAHAPHYLQVSPNPRVSQRLVESIMRVLGIDVNVAPLQEQSLSFDERVEQALENEPEVISYVQRLESHWDERRRRRGQRSQPIASPDEMPDPQELVREMEEFLRQSRNIDDSHESA